MNLPEPPAAALPAELQDRLADLVARRLGLAFQGERRGLLARGIGAAAAESGFADLSAYAMRLLAAPAAADELGLLASHLTIGETYFLREPETLEFLRQDILPELLARRGRSGSDERRLRLWSAGCATGEEAYSLAMLLDRVVADRDAWHVDLLATDVNPRFLAQARRGVFRDWSFRAMPEETRRAFFRRLPQGAFEIAPRLRRQVQFAPLNLAEPVYPATANGTAGLDVILCRNVLIYFGPAQARAAVSRLAECLRPGGRLLIGAAEAGLSCFTGNDALEPILPTLYRKRVATGARSAPNPPRPPRKQAACRAVAGTGTQAATHRRAMPTDTAALCRQAKEALRARRHEEAIRLATEWQEAAPLDTAPCLLAARIQADRGALASALDWADRALARDGMQPEGHYLRGSILSELGRRGEATATFNRALYLAPDFIPAHYGLGLLALQEAKGARARRHFDNALAILSARPAEQEIADLEGISVRDLAGMIRALREASVAEAMA